MIGATPVVAVPFNGGFVVGAVGGVVGSSVGLIVVGRNAYLYAGSSFLAIVSFIQRLNLLTSV